MDVFGSEMLDGDCSQIDRNLPNTVNLERGLYSTISVEVLVEGRKLLEKTINSVVFDVAHVLDKNLRAYCESI